jgi:cleavage and polyadenylation specificity factor subunit 3
MMNARIRAQMDVSNPFRFRYIQNLKSIDVANFDDSGASVVFASPGMLQNGVSRQLFDRWATDPRNGVLIAGYAVEHTLAHEIMNQPKEVVTLEGRRQPLNCLVDYVSFSAHVDFVQNRSFITQVDPKHIILVHGQKDQMGRLKSALLLQHRKLPEVSTSKFNLNDAGCIFLTDLLSCLFRINALQSPCPQTFKRSSSNSRVDVLPKLLDL